MAVQKTIRNAVEARGIGVHTGDTVHMTLRPAPVNTGVVFRLKMGDQIHEIPAKMDYVGDIRMSTCLVKDGCRIATVEHLLSAVCGLGIDNLIVELSSSEVPIMDGSAEPFVFLIKSAGIMDQNEALKKFIRIKAPKEVRDANKVARIEPYEGFKVRFMIDFDHPGLAKHFAEIDFSSTTYIKEIARARTFGFIRDFKSMKEQRLALGCNLDNTVIWGEKGVVNPKGLRFQDECVRHKILDAIGDLFLLGHPVVGAFYAERSGHALNNVLLKTLVADEDAWEIVTYEGKAPIEYASMASMVEHDRPIDEKKGA